MAQVHPPLHDPSELTAVTLAVTVAVTLAVKLAVKLAVTLVVTYLDWALTSLPGSASRPRRSMDLCARRAVSCSR